MAPDTATASTPCRARASCKSGGGIGPESRNRAYKNRSLLEHRAQFRVARRSKTSNVQIKEHGREIIVQATQDGYSRLKEPVMHSRTWKVKENNIEIIDQLQGQGFHTIEIVFLLHPELIIEVKDKAFIIRNQNNKHCVIFHPDRAVETVFENAEYYPEFGIAQTTKRILCRYKSVIPCELKSRIEWIE